MPTIDQRLLLLVGAHAGVAQRGVLWPQQLTYRSVKLVGTLLQLALDLGDRRHTTALDDRRAN